MEESSDDENLVLNSYHPTLHNPTQGDVEYGAGFALSGSQLVSVLARAIVCCFSMHSSMELSHLLQYDFLLLGCHWRAQFGRIYCGHKGFLQSST